MSIPSLIISTVLYSILVFFVASDGPVRDADVGVLPIVGVTPIVESTSKSLSPRIVTCRPADSTPGR